MADLPLQSSAVGTISAGQCSILRAGVPEAPVVVVASVDRVIAPDMTGLYESAPISDDINTVRLLQLNQTGHALVGWFTKPPSFVTPHPWLGFDLDEAVLVADLDPAGKTTDGAWTFYYRSRSVDATDLDPTYVLRSLDGDPLKPSMPWPKGHPPEDVDSGTITSQTLADGRLSVTVTFTRGPSRLFLMSFTFTRFSSERRLSSRAAKVQNDTARHGYQIYQQRYVPPVYLTRDDTSWADAVALLAPGSDLVSHITAYVNECKTFLGVISFPNSAVQDVNMLAIRKALRFPWDNDPLYASTLNLYLARIANNTILVLPPISGIDQDDRPMSIADWLAWILVKEEERCRTEEKTFVYPLEFNKLLAGATVYRYEIAFHDLSYSFGGGKFKPAGSGSLGGFQVEITRSMARRDKDGVIKDDAWQKDTDHGDTVARYRGAFFEGKYGLNDPPGLPDSITVYSSEFIPPSAFGTAWFLVQTVDASVSASLKLKAPFVSTKVAGIKAGGTTHLLTLHVAGDVLEGTFTDATLIPKWSVGPKASPDISAGSWDTIKRCIRGEATEKDFNPFPKSWKDIFSWSVGVTMGLGRFFWTLNDAQWKEAPSGLGASSALDSACELVVGPLFERDKYAIDRMINGWSGRFLLETILATECAVFSGLPEIHIRGYASLEGTPNYNCGLSQNRAAVVRAAMEDAFGQPFDDDYTFVEQYGEDGARSASLLDPPEDPALEKSWEATHQEEVAKWPEWRKVEVTVRGKVTLRVLTVDQSDEGPAGGASPPPGS